MLSEVLRAGCEPTAGHSHLSTPDSILMCYLADQIMPRSSLSPTFPLGKSPCHVCPTRHNPDMRCFSLLVPSRRKGEAYDRARLYTHLCDYPLAVRATGAPPGYPCRHPVSARVCPRQYPADVACWRTVWAVVVPARLSHCRRG